MKVLMLNGSPKQNGNTALLLDEIAKVLAAEGVESTVLWIGNKPIADCTGCHVCHETGACAVRDDIVPHILEEAKQCDGLIVGSPIYFAHPRGQVISALDRLFSSGRQFLYHKPAACVVCGRRAGGTAALDVINKYFAVSNMPIVSSTQWNVTYGRVPGEIFSDAEGLQTVANLGRNMAWLIKCIAAGRDAGLQPKTESGAFTCFVR